MSQKHWIVSKIKRFKNWIMIGQKLPKEKEEEEERMKEKTNG